MNSATSEAREVQMEEEVLEGMNPVDMGEGEENVCRYCFRHVDVYL